MCQPAVCKQCAKVTWRGCGMHVEQVMAGVPASNRCSCERTSAGGSGVLSALKGLFGRS